MKYDAEMLKYKQKKEAVASEGKKAKKKKSDIEQGELKPLIEIGPENDEVNKPSGKKETPKKT